MAKKRSPTDAYYIAFGQFINHYARAESTVHLLFWHCTGLAEHATARAIAAEANIKTVIKWTRTLAGNFPPEKSDEIKAVLNHLEQIGELRNALVHRGAEIKGDAIESVNLMMARTEEGIQIIRLNIQDIKNASDDLVRVVVRLGVVMYPPLLEIVSAPVKQALRAPWRYKRSEPEFPYRKKNPPGLSKEKPPGKPPILH